MGPTRSADGIHQTRRQRRLTAGQLFEQGEQSDAQIAHLLGASVSSVRKWHHAWNAGGPDALRGDRMSEAKHALDQTQRQDLRELLRRGAKDYGFATNIWTLARIRQVINEQFAVAYDSLSGISRLLHRMGFTAQPATHQAPGHKGGPIWDGCSSR